MNDFEEDDSGSDTNEEIENEYCKQRNEDTFSCNSGDGWEDNAYDVESGSEKSDDKKVDSTETIQTILDKNTSLWSQSENNSHINTDVSGPKKRDLTNSLIECSDDDDENGDGNVLESLSHEILINNISDSNSLTSEGNEKFTSDFKEFCKSAESFVSESETISQKISNVNTMLNYMNDLSTMTTYKRVGSAFQKNTLNPYSQIAPIAEEETETTPADLIPIMEDTSQRKKPQSLIKKTKTIPEQLDSKTNTKTKKKVKVSKPEKLAEKNSQDDLQGKKKVKKDKVKKSNSSIIKPDVIHATGEGSVDSTLKNREHPSKTTISSKTSKKYLRNKIKNDFLEMECRIVQKYVEKKIRPPQNTPIENVKKFHLPPPPPPPPPSLTKPKSFASRSKIRKSITPIFIAARLPTPKRSVRRGVASKSLTINNEQKNRQISKTPANIQQLFQDIKTKKLESAQKSFISLAVINL